MKNIIKTTLALVIIFALISLVLYHQNQGTSQILPSPSPVASPLYNDFHLVIPVLNIEAPVIADVDGNNKKAYNRALEDGVAQLLGSAKPGESSNIFIFGHSSNYWWNAGNYKKIFATLPNLNIGDEIDLWYNQKEYKYKVTKLKTVLPDNINVTDKTSSEQLSLMTCVPIGTDQKRLIVIAKPIEN